MNKPNSWAECPVVNQEYICPFRSADTIPELEKQFEIVERRDLGGTLLYLVLDNIAENLSDTEEGKTILRNLFAEEQRLMKEGVISSDLTLLVARKK